MSQLPKGSGTTSLVPCGPSGPPRPDGWVRLPPGRAYGFGKSRARKKRWDPPMTGLEKEKAFDAAAKWVSVVQCVSVGEASTA